MGDGDLLAQDSGSDSSVGRDDVEVTPDSEAYDSEGDTGALTTGRGRGWARATASANVSNVNEEGRGGAGTLANWTVEQIELRPRP